ncbi:hypothetical protein IAT38_004455 [Cryptococcus sp. DSM 104549]
MPESAPFWLCHECGAEMRPVKVDDVNHCASCNGEFIEILDPEINPDPYHDLPPPPPTRPGLNSNPNAPPPPLANVHHFGFDFPLGAPGQGGQGGGQGEAGERGGGDAGEGAGGGGGGGGGGFLSSFFNMLNNASRPPTEGNPSDRPPPAFPGEPGAPDYNAQAGGSSGGGDAGARTYSFNIGGGRGSVTFGTFGGVFGGGRGAAGGFNDPDPFRADPPGLGRQPHPEDFQNEASELLRTMAAFLNGPGGLAIPANFGDYAASEQDYRNILEQFMQAAGPQGPVPANETVIQGLPRSTFDEKSLAASTYKDCPVCKDDYEVGQEVMKVPCGHIFHPDCLQPWLRQNGTCPVCRFSLVGEEEARAHREAEAAARARGEGPRDGAEGQPEGPNAIPVAITDLLSGLFGGGAVGPAGGDLDQRRRPQPPPRATSGSNSNDTNSNPNPERSQRSNVNYNPDYDYPDPSDDEDGEDSAGNGFGYGQDSAGVMGLLHELLRSGGMGGSGPATPAREDAPSTGPSRPSSSAPVASGDPHPAPAPAGGDRPTTSAEDQNDGDDLSEADETDEAIAMYLARERQAERTRRDFQAAQEARRRREEESQLDSYHDDLD